VAIAAAQARIPARSGKAERVATVIGLVS
jgi:hypothetical protein